MQSEDVINRLQVQDSFVSSNLLKLKLTEPKVGDRLHLTQVPRTSVDDASVSSAPTGEGCHLGSAGKGSKLGTRDDPQPVVRRALMR